MSQKSGLPSTPWTFHLSGGRLCLDLANTVSWRRSGQPIERLRDYGDLVAWAGQAGIVSVAEARALAREARRRPAAAARVLGRARALREAIYRVFAALAARRPPDPADLAHLDRELHEALGSLRLAGRRGGFALTWPPTGGRLAHPLWAAGRSAAEVLTSDDLGRLKTCPSPTCGWIFLDTTRRGNRRWCDMRVCGNRAKARHYYARRRAQGSRGRAAHAGRRRRGREGKGG